MPHDADFSIVWDKTLQSLRKEIDPISFDIWFSMVKFKNFHNNKLYISVPNSLTKEWIESRYLNTIQKFLFDLTRQDVTLVLTIDEYPEKPCNTPFFNSKYTFETFIVGNSNRFAHAACYAVAESPAKAYNPLFIYGGVGLGKTHLLQAIGHHIINKYHSFSVMYVSSEQFTNDLISSIKDDNTFGFRNKYRNIDVLLIDDIQFLAGKERTQEEFFHTFNSLYEANKQLVISSDRPPRNIPTLEDRLRSRFEWGLITDIQPPDIETRIAILRKKAQLENLNIPNDIIDYIADCIESNIRELEGALIRLAAYSSITKKPLDIKTVKEALKDVLPPPRPKKITIENIQNAVCSYYNLEKSELISKKRNKKVAYPRQIAMYLCRKLTDASYPQIGESFGGRDHTTVMHANEKVEDLLKKDRDLNLVIEELCKKINPNYLR